MQQRITRPTSRWLYAAVLAGLLGCGDEASATFPDDVAEQKAPSSTRAGAAPVIKEVFITGSGCRPGTATLFQSDLSMTVAFNSFQLKTQKGPMTRASLNCGMLLQIPDTIKGELAISGVGLTGVGLAKKGRATVGLRYGRHFGGQPRTTSAELTGPTFGGWSRWWPVTTTATANWSSCLSDSGPGDTHDYEITLSVESDDEALFAVNTLDVSFVMRPCSIR